MARVIHRKNTPEGPRAARSAAAPDPLAESSAVTVEKTNHEGLTWPEWAYAAGVLEPRMLGHHATHEAAGYAHLYVNERRAWRNGEDPTEWRADEDKNRPK